MGEQVSARAYIRAMRSHTNATSGIYTHICSPPRFGQRLPRPPRQQDTCPLLSVNQHKRESDQRVAKQKETCVRGYPRRIFPSSPREGARSHPAAARRDSESRILRLCDAVVVGYPLLPGKIRQTNPMTTRKVSESYAACHHKHLPREGTAERPRTSLRPGKWGFFHLSYSKPLVRHELTDLETRASRKKRLDGGVTDVCV